MAVDRDGVSVLSDAKGISALPSLPPCLPHTARRKRKMRIKKPSRKGRLKNYETCGRDWKEEKEENT